MKKISLIASILLLSHGCIQTDLEDPFSPTLRIENSINEIDFRVSGTYALSAVYTDETGEAIEASIQWSSSNNDVLSFDGASALPHQEGLVLITASFNDLSDTKAVEIFPSREMITISGFPSSIQVGDKATFNVTYLNADGQTLTITPSWSSSDASIATVDANGTVTAEAAGNVDITAKFGEVMHSVNIEVVAETVVLDPEIQITAFASFLKEGETFSYQAQYIDQTGNIDGNIAIAWSSSNESVLSINANGIATARGAGFASITASFENITASVNVMVESSGITERTGNLMGTGYDIRGAFSLKKDANDSIILTITNYQPDGPGPYFYLTNQNSNVVNGLKLGKAETRGTVTINVSKIDNTVQLSSYNYLMVWCEPFGVRLGFGEFIN